MKSSTCKAYGFFISNLIIVWFSMLNCTNKEFKDYEQYKNEIQELKLEESIIQRLLVFLTGY